MYSDHHTIHPGLRRAWAGGYDGSKQDVQQQSNLGLYTNDLMLHQGRSPAAAALVRDPCNEPRPAWGRPEGSIAQLLHAQDQRQQQLQRERMMANIHDNHIGLLHQRPADSIPSISTTTTPAFSYMAAQSAVMAHSHSKVDIHGQNLSSSASCSWNASALQQQTRTHGVGGVVAAAGPAVGMLGVTTMRRQGNVGAYSPRARRERIER